MPGFDAIWRTRLEARRRDALLRERLVLSSPAGVIAKTNDCEWINFASNDYLGLAGHLQVKQAATEAISRFGTGSGASHLVSGHHQEHEALEQELAEFTGRERSLVFSTGYMANLAVISALLGKQDSVFEDRLNHASLIDGALLSGARFQRYLHNQPESLATRLQRFQTKNSDKGTDKSTEESALKLVVTDGVFSMDGDIADLRGLAEVCEVKNALLMVDDAHGLGVLGETGGGSLETLGLTQKQVPVLVGTFGKAFGTSGAFVAGSKDLIEYLEQFSRPYIYTTAMPPANAAATRAALRIIRAGHDLRAQLFASVNYFKAGAEALGLSLLASETPIQPVLVGDSARTVELGQYLRRSGLLVGAIRPPTVPEGSARLRITFSSLHRRDQIDKLLDALADAKGGGLL